MSGLADLVLAAARARGDEEVPYDCVVEALEGIEQGLFECPRYPTGVPSLREVHRIACRLWRAARERAA